jgi:hypothetical protein
MRELRMTRVVVLLKNGDGQRFNAYCEEKGHKKSPLIARLIREHLDREGFASQSRLFESSKGPPPKRKQTKAVRGVGRDRGSKL